MARWQVTIRDPLGVLPDLAIANLAGGYSRNVVQQISLAEFTRSGNAVLKGTTTPHRYSWQIVARMAELDALHLFALIQRQQERYAALADGHLLLVDEVEYLIPRSVQPYAVVAGSTISPLTGTVTGFGIVPVLLEISDNPVAHLGVSGAGDYYKIVTFKATEV